MHLFIIKTVEFFIKYISKWFQKNQQEILKIIKDNHLKSIEHDSLRAVLHILVNLILTILTRRGELVSDNAKLILFSLHHSAPETKIFAFISPFSTYPSLAPPTREAFNKHSLNDELC